MADLKHDDDDEKFAASIAATLDVVPHVDALPTPSLRKRGRDEADDYLTGNPEEATPSAKKHARRPHRAQAPVKKLNESSWNMMFDRLVAYKERHGDCLVPKRYQEDPKLGTWVETQRVQYKKLEKEIAEDGTSEAVTPNNRLNEERLTRLEEIGFAWSAKHVRKSKQPTSSATGIVSIGGLSSSGAAYPVYGGRPKKPPLDQAARLAARQRVHDAQWNEMYERLVAYVNKYGDCLVPKKFEEDPKLASWVENQRVMYNRESKLGKEKSEGQGASGARIESKSVEEWAIEMDKSGVTATAEDAAEVAATMTEAAMEVVNEVVEDPTPDQTTELTAGVEPTSIMVPPVEAASLLIGPPAPMNAIGEDSKPPAKVLGPDKIAKLDAIDFVWSLRTKRIDDHWDLMFQQLVAYKNDHGDCLVPSRYDANFKLGKWVETQRYEYTKLQRAEENGDDLPVNPRLTEERQRRLESIGFEWKVKHKMKRYYDRQWDAQFQKLLQFKEENGHCLVPKRYNPDVKLGTWVHTQRIQYRKMMQGIVVGKAEGKPEDSEEQSFRLTEERRRRLEEAGFVWSARDTEKSEPTRMTRNSYDDQWDAMFLRLTQYKQQNGNCLVPKRYKEDPKLGTWVDTQRVQFKKMKKQLAKDGLDYVPPAPLDENKTKMARKPLVGRLTEDRIRRLEGLGFVWSLRDDWQKHYGELVEYKKETGNCNVPARYNKNRRLGIWVSAQRQQYKLLMQAGNDPTSKPRRSAPLTQERIDMLNALGFTWTIRSRDTHQESWNLKLEQLKKFKEQHGHVLVPARYAENPELGIWVGTQRTQYRIYQESLLGQRIVYNTTSMNEDRIRQLEELGFVWALRAGSDSLWRKHFGELAEFRELHGHCAVPSQYRLNPELAEWAVEQRLAYNLKHSGKHCSLDDEKFAELDSVGFAWKEPNQAIVDEVDRVVATTNLLHIDRASPTPAVMTDHHSFAESHHHHVMIENEEMTHVAQETDVILEQAIVEGAEGAVHQI